MAAPAVLFIDEIGEGLVKWCQTSALESRFILIDTCDQIHLKHSSESVRDPYPPTDALVSARDGKSNGVQEKVLSALLNEMDGVGVRVDAGASAKVGRITVYSLLLAKMWNDMKDVCEVLSHPVS